MIVKEGKFANIKIKALLYEYEEFEIYRTLTGVTLLIIRNSLYEKWLSEKLFYAVNPFKQVDYLEDKYFYIISPKEYKIIPISIGNVICNRQEAVQFAFAIKQMRQYTKATFYDGVYLEEYGYVLPAYTQNNMSDDATIGCYISGGRSVHYSDEDFSPLCLDEFALEEISDITGIARNKKPIITDETTSYKPEKFTLAGRPEIEKFFNEHIIDILNEPERYKRLGIEFPSSVILYGPPGCGKTYAVDKLAEYLGLPRFDINSSAIASPYIHDTAKKIASVFESAIKNAPSIIVIDEMESYLSNRETLSSNSQHFEEVAEFLRQIQEAQKNKVLIIAMTNMYDKIDPAILRRGRFDHHIEVGLPSEDEIYSLLKKITEKIVLSDEISLKDLSKTLAGKTLADVAFVIKEAGLISGRNGDDKITLSAINGAVESLPKEQKRRSIGFGKD